MGAFLFVIYVSVSVRPACDNILQLDMLAFIFSICRDEKVTETMFNTALYKGLVPFLMEQCSFSP